MIFSFIFNKLSMEVPPNNDNLGGMGMKKFMYIDILVIGLMMFGLLFLGGCATTGQSYGEEEPVGDVNDIDRILGLSEEDPSIDETIDEDDVLKLLGVMEEGTSDIQSSENQQKSYLENELNQLEAEKSDLYIKEDDLNKKISDQQNMLASIEKSKLQDTAPSAGERTSFAERYQDAYQTYLNRRYQDAIQKFEALLKENAKHSLSDNCQYWIGESYYGLEKFEQAVMAFQRVFTFSRSNKDADAQLKIGICHLRLNDNEKAKQEFQRLIDNYPTSQYVSIAQRYMGSIN